MHQRREALVERKDLVPLSVLLVVELVPVFGLSVLQVYWHLSLFALAPTNLVLHHHPFQFLLHH